MPTIPPPPLSFRHRDDEGYFTIPWQRHFLKQQEAAAASAPADAHYVVVSPDGDLPNAANLGALDSGWVHSAVSLGAATLGSFPVVYQDLAPTVNVSIPANMGAIVPDHFTLAAGKVLTLAAGAVFEIT
jgi:hypothetical protein